MSDKNESKVEKIDMNDLTVKIINSVMKFTEEKLGDNAEVMFLIFPKDLKNNTTHFASTLQGQNIIKELRNRANILEAVMNEEIATAKQEAINSTVH